MNRFLLPLSLLLAVLLLLLAQCTWGYRWSLGGVHVELLPPLLFYAAFTVSLPTALLLALLAATMYDSFSGGYFGASMLPYVLSTALFCGIRPIFFRNRISTQFFSGFVFGFIALFLQWTLCGKFIVGIAHVVPKITCLALLMGILAVIYFAVLDLFCSLMGVIPRRGEEPFA